MILLIDNYDSFTYNLYQYMCELGGRVRVVRNDAMSVEQIGRLRPHGIVISPGPGTPADAGVTIEVIRELSPNIPLLGVCLGHQALAAAFGGEVVRAPKPIHGKTALIHHDGKGLFSSIPSPLRATRYHSLVVSTASLPSCLRVTARNPEGLIMGIRHRRFPAEGVQFHPESIMTEHGLSMMKNFLHRCARGTLHG